MKVGDFVGWADTWSDEEGCEPAGIVLDVSKDFSPEITIIILSNNGNIQWKDSSDLVVMFEVD